MPTSICWLTALSARNGQSSLHVPPPRELLEYQAAVGAVDLWTLLNPSLWPGFRDTVEWEIVPRDLKPIRGPYSTIRRPVLVTKSSQSSQGQNQIVNLLVLLMAIPTRRHFDSGFAVSTCMTFMNWARQSSYSYSKVFIEELHY